MVHVQAPAARLSRKERAVVFRLLASIKDDPETRWRLQTKLISLTVAIIFGVIGGGFLFASRHASAAPATYQLLVNLEGSLKVHGAVMMVLSGCVLYTSSEYRWQSRVALALMGFYAMASGLLLMGSWFLAKVAFPAPWWYFLVAGLCLILVRVAPPAVRSRRGRGSTDGSGRA